MQNDINKQSCLRKTATVLKYKDGIATVRLHNDGEGCNACGGTKQSSCVLYTFGSIFSRQRGIWQIPSKHPVEKGQQVQLLSQADTLLKAAVGCYGLPIAMLIGSATIAHLLWNIEWLTILIGLGSLAISYLFAKRWLRFINIPNIQLIQ